MPDKFDSKSSAHPRRGGDNSFLQRWKRVFPPYAKYAIFFACGLEVLYHAFIMAINQKFFDMASKIFPVAFEMFNDTMRRGASENKNYHWGPEELAQLNLYETKLILMWFVSTVAILLSMLSVVPQFCETEEASGEERTWCMKKPIIGAVMAPVLVGSVILVAIVLTWQWFTCEADSRLFNQLFNDALKEEQYLSVIEREFSCITDDDKEAEAVPGGWLEVIPESITGQSIVADAAPPVRTCTKLIDGAILNNDWLNPLFFVFIVYHILIVLLFGYFNDEHYTLPCTKTPPPSESDISGDVESGARLL
uniref:Transmembrane protein n=1 Tax=Panagrellus redivivus TaxID=6233 RepID=A0A7E4VSP8_PANRE